MEMLIFCSHTILFQLRLFASQPYGQIQNRAYKNQASFANNFKRAKMIEGEWEQGQIKPVYGYIMLEARFVLYGNVLYMYSGWDFSLF